MSYEIAIIPTPLGDARALVRDGALCALQLATGAAPRASSPLSRLDRLTVRETRDPAGVASALARYFRGDLDALDTLAVAPEGTAFQRRVWTALRRIPHGATSTYGAIAREIGMPSASRAVGAANGANPIWIVVPCHRVIGTSGKLTGYAGGLDVKRWLLAHEAAAVTGQRSLLGPQGFDRIECGSAARG